MNFIGRKQELQQLKELGEFPRPALVTIMGRRRIGKSRLVEEFAKNKIFLPFSGLPPTPQMTAQDQRDAFARQFSTHFRQHPLTFLDWSDAFNHLGDHLTKKSTVILLDEISWMASKDNTFIPKLKVWGDLILQKYPNVFLIFCGSVSPWIEENIVKSTAFFGRISLQIQLEELSLGECATFLRQSGFKGSTHDMLKVLSVTGGVPWYLEQIHPQKSVDQNLKALCFDKKGLLVQEFERIFSDLFSSRGEIYKKIVQILSKGMRDREQIRKELNYARSGSLTDYLESLIICGFVTKHYSWSLKTGDLKKQHLYRLSDNYLRFFLKYIEPDLPKITSDSYRDLVLSQLPGWDSIMGFQVENMLLKNRHLLLKALGVTASEIVADNPYYQKSSAPQKGCQIDYLVQTQMNNLYVCEFKFLKREIGPEIIEAMKDKIARFVTPKGYGTVPILFHLGGVTEGVYDQRYFYRIIDIGDFLEGE